VKNRPEIRRPTLARLLHDGNDPAHTDEVDTQESDTREGDTDQVNEEQTSWQCRAAKVWKKLKI
jgi:hypothetical protein